MTNLSTSPTRPAPPLGGFQQLDGRRVFTHRQGDGGPAVVFLPGASAVGLDYYGVQQQVAEFTTAVVYDRSGTGYSDPVPLPRTAAAVADELRELLRAQDIPGPYVLAAHSLGAAYAFRFAQSYPRDVAGLVWLDGFHREWDDFVPAAMSLAETERLAPDPKRLEQLRPMLRETFAELRAGYPRPVREALLAAKVSDDWLRAGIAERGTLVAIAEELRAGPGVPDVPLIALTVTGVDPALPRQTALDLNDAKSRMDAALAGSVSRGRHRVVSDTFHHRLCFDRADAVVRAIRDVVDAREPHLDSAPSRFT